MVFGWITGHRDGQLCGIPVRRSMMIGCWQIIAKMGADARIRCGIGDQRTPIDNRLLRSLEKILATRHF